MVWNGAPPRPGVTPGHGSQQQHIDRAIETLEDTVQRDNVAFLWTGGKEANVIADLLLYAVGEGWDDRADQMVPFVTVDTGNHYDEMYQFRTEYVAPGDNGASTVGPPQGVDDHRVVTYTDLLEEVIHNDDDPRGYHGEWDATVELPDEDPIPGLPRSPDGWDVPASCGALKTVPLRRLITGESAAAPDGGFDTLITGRRGDDPLVPTEGGFERSIERSTPAPHTRINPLAGWSEANVYAYTKMESVSLPTLYTERGFRHTDAECCTDDQQVGEHGEGGRDPEKEQARDRLEDMGYV